MAVTDKQVLLLMKNHEKTGSIETAAAKAGMCRQTASKYLQGAKMPSEAKTQNRVAFSRLVRPNARTPSGFLLFNWTGSRAAFCISSMWTYWMTLPL